jgi:hypothetical protein
MREDIPHPIFSGAKYDHNAPFKEKVLCNSFAIFRDIFNDYKAKGYDLVIKNDDFNQRFGYVVYVPLFMSVEGTWYLIDGRDVHDGKKWGWTI